MKSITTIKMKSDLFGKDCGELSVQAFSGSVALILPGGKALEFDLIESKKLATAIQEALAEN